MRAEGNRSVKFAVQRYLDDERHCLVGEQRYQVAGLHCRGEELRCRSVVRLYQAEEQPCRGVVQFNPHEANLKQYDQIHNGSTVSPRLKSSYNFPRRPCSQTV